MIMEYHYIVNNKLGTRTLLRVDQPVPVGWEWEDKSSSSSREVKKRDPKPCESSQDIMEGGDEVA